MHIAHGTMPKPILSTKHKMAIEQSHWRSGYPHRPCFSEGLPFERYLPTFAFAQKSFVPGPSRDAANVPVHLCATYKDSVAACDRIDWNEAEMIISTTWTQMQAEAQAQEMNLKRYAEAHYAKRLPL